MENKGLIVVTICIIIIIIVVSIVWSKPTNSVISTSPVISTTPVSHSIPAYNLDEDDSTDKGKEYLVSSDEKGNLKNTSVECTNGNITVNSLKLSNNWVLESSNDKLQFKHKDNQKMTISSSPSIATVNPYLFLSHTEMGMNVKYKGIIPFNKILKDTLKETQNISSFDASTSKYTVPISGIYMINLTAFGGIFHDTILFGLEKNQSSSNMSIIGYLPIACQPIGGAGIGSVTIPLQKNDIIWITATCNSTAEVRILYYSIGGVESYLTTLAITMLQPL